MESTKKNTIFVKLCGGRTKQIGLCGEVCV